MGGYDGVMQDQKIIGLLETSHLEREKLVVIQKMEMGI